MPRRFYRVEPPVDASDTKRAWDDLNTQLTILSDALHNFEINSGGTLYFKGDGTVWDDLRVPSNAIHIAGVADPDFSTFTTGGLHTWLFDAAAKQSVFFSAQLPHSYKLGTAIYPHLHWSPVDATTGTVSWALEYSWADIDQRFPTPSTIFCYALSKQVYPSHQLNSFPAISPTRESGKNVSGMIMCHLYRYASDTVHDTYAADAALLEFDFHFEIDTIGSREEAAK